MTDGDRYDQGCRDTRAVLMPEIERLRAALNEIRNLREDSDPRITKGIMRDIAIRALTAAK